MSHTAVVHQSIMSPAIEREAKTAVVEVASSDDEEPAITSTGRRMTLIASSATSPDELVDEEFDQGDYEADDADDLSADDAVDGTRTDNIILVFVTRTKTLHATPYVTEEYEDEADDYYEKYSDEDELRCADADDQQSQHAFEQQAYRSNHVNESPTVDGEHLDDEEKHGGVAADSPPPPAASPTAANDRKQTEPHEYDDEDEDEADYDHVGDYDDDDEYDEEDSHGVSDVDDSELMQRLESKYGKLPTTPAAMGGEDSEEEFVRPDSPPVAPARR